MGQIVLDENIFDAEVLIPLARWITVQRLRDLRPGEVVKDERVPMILRQLRQPTFVTIDMGFWNAGLRDAHYCILCFPLPSDEQHAIPGLLRQLFRLPEFATKAARMGKVARISQAQIDYWQTGHEQIQRILPQRQWKNWTLREEALVYEVEAQGVSVAEEQIS